MVVRDDISVWLDGLPVQWHHQPRQATGKHNSWPPTLPFYKNILNLHGHVVTMSNYNKLQTVNRKSDCEHLILTVKSQRGFSHFMTRNNDWQRINELSSAFSLHIFPLKNKAWFGLGRKTGSIPGALHSCLLSWHYCCCSHQAETFIKHLSSFIQWLLRKGCWAALGHQ